MRRSLFILLIVVVAAGYLGTLIARDPGYVLVTYGGYSLQSSLWVMLGLIGGLCLLAYVVLRATGVVRKVPQTFQGWRGNQKTRRATELTLKGQRLLAEGEYARAQKFLESGVDSNPGAAVNYLKAAVAANHLGDGEARESLLRLAEEADVGMARAKAVVAAELALDREEPEVALRILQNLKSNAHILRLKASALQASCNWREMLSSVAEIRKTDHALALEIERQAAALGLDDESASDTSRHQLFKSLSSELKQDAACITRYVKSLDDDSEAEPMLRSAIKKSWQPELVALYGELGEDSLKVRLKNAENWQKKHSTDASLQYCLGCIYAGGGELSLARESLMRCVELGEVPGSRQKLGQLLAAEGQYERSVEQLSLALKNC